MIGQEKISFTQIVEADLSMYPKESLEGAQYFLNISTEPASLTTHTIQQIGAGAGLLGLFVASQPAQDRAFIAIK